MLIGGYFCISAINFALSNYKTLHLNHGLAKTGK